jgi:heme exporter protein D
MKKFIDDYEVVVQENAKGREKRVAVYVGDYYEINLDETEFTVFRHNSLLFIALIVIGQIAAGFVGNLGMYTFFVSLPYVFTFLPLYFLVDGILRLPKEKRQFRRDEAELIFKRMKTAGRFLLPLIGITIIGEVVFMIWLTSGIIWQEFLFLGIEIVLLVIVFMIFRMHQPIEVTRIHK